jgi:putative membrane protein
MSFRPARSRQPRRLAALAPLAAVSLALSACASTPRVSAEAAGALALPPAGAPLAPLPPMPADAPGKMFADARIAATASRSNFSEIEPSRLAVQRAQMDGVKQYAQMMIAEHEVLERQMREMLAAKGVMPVDNAFSLQLQRNLQPTLDMLRSRQGAQFDMDFMNHMVSSHMLTLHTLDTSLIPEADDPQMKAMLRDVVRPKVAAHLQQAQALQVQVIRGMGR